MYTVMRSSGMIFAMFNFGHMDVDDDFEVFCKDIDEDLLAKAPQLILEFRADLDKINSEHGIDADLSFPFRLLEFGRVKIVQLKKLGVVDALQDTSENLSKESAALQAAFEFGFAAGQYAVHKHSEEFFWAGVNTLQAREVGQERARRALTLKGKKTRAAVERAAEEVRRRRPDIAHNIAALAREIQKLGNDELCRSDGSPIAEGTICKYLRERRKLKKPENRQECPDSGKTSR
jgi:hypothetical protein